MFRYRTGCPWSWSLSGPSLSPGTSGSPRVVLPQTSTSFCTLVPFHTTVIRAGLTFVLPLHRGARNAMS